jgi:glutamate--cysteine ligase
MIKNKEQFDQFIVSNWNEVNDYLDQEATKVPVPFYNSVDIRESKTKYAPVDNNIYPAGFNNICLMDLDETSYQVRAFINDKKLEHKHWAILIESHTKNTFYLENLFFLKKALLESGIEKVDFISFDATLFPDGPVLELVTASQFDIQVHLAKTSAKCITVNDEPINIVILNNDQSKPIDINWSQISTPIFPPPQIGWYNRQKIDHFEKYFSVVKSFSDRFNLDPNLLCAKSKAFHNVDFSTKESFEKLAKSVDQLKATIDSSQKIFLKASKGTYGMGIQVVSGGDEILKMNRKVRNKMDVGKNKIKFTDVLIQEGIDTILTYDQMPAEVTIYLVNGKSVGGFMRANSQKDHQSNLNSKGMVFKKFCISEIRQNQDFTIKEAVYSVIARLSSLAAGLEINDLKKE